jgi:hypothetical protein
MGARVLTGSCDGRCRLPTSSWEKRGESRFDCATTFALGVNDMHLSTGHERRSVWPAAVLAFLFLWFAGCGDEASTPSVSSLSQETQPRSAPAALEPLPPELVGTWETEKWLDQSGSQKIERTYVFSPDGGYEYTIAMCRSSTDCSLVSQESGYAQAANGMLSLEPQTESDEGARGWPYVVGRDPNVGDIQLHFTLPDGQVDIFYFG